MQQSSVLAKTTCHTLALSKTILLSKCNLKSLQNIFQTYNFTAFARVNQPTQFLYKIGNHYNFLNFYSQDNIKDVYFTQHPCDVFTLMQRDVNKFGQKNGKRDCR